MGSLLKPSCLIVERLLRICDCLRTDNDNDGLVDEDTGLRQPYELVGGREYVFTFMENSADEFGQQIHLYMAVAPDADSSVVNVTIR